MLWSSCVVDNDLILLFLHACAGELVQGSEINDNTHTYCQENFYFKLNLDIGKLTSSTLVKRLRTLANQLRTLANGSLAKQLIGETTGYHQV